jgi:hypothetical protein
MRYERPAVERRVPVQDPVIRGVLAAIVSTPTWTGDEPPDDRSGRAA